MSLGELVEELSRLRSALAADPDMVADGGARSATAIDRAEASCRRAQRLARPGSIRSKLGRTLSITPRRNTSGWRDTPSGLDVMMAVVRVLLSEGRETFSRTALPLARWAVRADGYHLGREGCHQAAIMGEVQGKIVASNLVHLGVLLVGASENSPPSHADEAEATELFERAEEIASRFLGGDHLYAATIHLARMGCLIRLADNRSRLFSTRLGKDSAPEVGHRRRRLEDAEAAGRKAVAALRAGSYHPEALGILTDARFVAKTCAAYTGLAKVLGDLGRHKEAEEALTEALPYSSDYPLRHETSRAHITALLVTHAAEQGDALRALDMARQSHAEVRGRARGLPSHDPVAIAAVYPVAVAMDINGMHCDAAPLFRLVVREMEGWAGHHSYGPGHPLAASGRALLRDCEEARATFLAAAAPGPGPAAAAAATLRELAAPGSPALLHQCARCGAGEAGGASGLGAGAGAGMGSGGVRLAAELQPCGLCGYVYYCSDECRGADWRRGHAAACLRAREGG